jgi:hypothetical protein
MDPNPDIFGLDIFDDEAAASSTTAALTCDDIVAIGAAGFARGPGTIVSLPAIPSGKAPAGRRNTPGVQAKAAGKKKRKPVYTQSLITRFGEFDEAVPSAKKPRRNSVLDQIMSRAPPIPVLQIPRAPPTTATTPTASTPTSAEIVDFDDVAVVPVVEQVTPTVEIESLDALIQMEMPDRVAYDTVFGGEVTASLFDGFGDDLLMDPNFFSDPAITHAVDVVISNTAHDLYLKRVNLCAFDPTTDRIETASPESIGLMTETAFQTLSASYPAEAREWLFNTRASGLVAATEILRKMPDVPIVTSAEEVYHMRDVVLAYMPKKNFTDMLTDLDTGKQKDCWKYRREAKNRLNAWLHNTNRTAHIQSLHSGLRMAYSMLEKTTARYVAMATEFDREATLDYVPLKLESAVTRVLTSKHGKLPVAKVGRKRETRIKIARDQSGFSPVSPAFC